MVLIRSVLEGWRSRGGAVCGSNLLNSDGCGVSMGLHNKFRSGMANLKSLGCLIDREVSFFYKFNKFLLFLDKKGVTLREIK